MAEPPADPDRFEQAIRAFRRRVPITDPEFRRLTAAERRRAFWVAGVAQGRIVQEVFEAIDRAVRDGTTLDDFKKQAAPALLEAWGGEDAPRVETVFRTNVMGAYNGGRNEVLRDPVVVEARPYWRFDAVGDSRMSEICEALDGTVRPADDPWWKTHTPPLHHQCRSVITPLTAEEAEGEGVTVREPEAPEPGEGFGRPPEPEDAEPDLGGFHPSIARILQRRLR